MIANSDTTHPSTDSSFTLAGDAAAQNALAQRLQKGIQRYLASRTYFGHHTQEDLAQTVQRRFFMRVAGIQMGTEKAFEGDAGDEFPTLRKFAFAILKNCCVDLSRARGRTTNMGDDDLDLVELTGSEEALFDQMIVSEAVRGAVDQITPASIGADLNSKEEVLRAKTDIRFYRMTLPDPHSGRTVSAFDLAVSLGIIDPADGNTEIAHDSIYRRRVRVRDELKRQLSTFLMEYLGGAGSGGLSNGVLNLPPGAKGTNAFDGYVAFYYHLPQSDKPVEP